MKGQRVLPLQGILLFFLPLTIALVVLTVWSINSHRREMRSVVSTRNEQTAVFLRELLLSNEPQLKALAGSPHQREDTISQLLNRSELLTTQRTIIIVDQSQTPVFTWGDLHPSDLMRQHPGVTEALLGKSGFIQETFPNGLHLISYAWIPALEWGIVVEETWLDTLGTTLNTTLFAPLLLIPMVLVSLFYLWATQQWVTRPLQQIHRFASAVGDGQLDQTLEPIKGIREVEELRDVLTDMAGKLAEAQHMMRRYASAIQTGQEEERQRLAQELHDDTIQSLVYLDQQTQLILSTSEAESERLEPKLNRLREQIALISQNLRHMIQGLRPTYLDELGLAPALEALVSDVAETARNSVLFQLTGKPFRVESDIEVAFYRIAQESISNAMRHAQAAEISVDLVYEMQKVSLKIQDNGTGFEVTRPWSNSGFGLTGMRERATKIGATLEILSVPSQGTELYVVKTIDTKL